MEKQLRDDIHRIERLREEWLAEEEIAHIHGWDFSHIHGRYEEDDECLPWDYKSVIERYRSNEMKILDIDTGGGEFLLSLDHPYCNLSATEGYGPNIDLCKEVLLPKGIDFRAADGTQRLPFEDSTFELIINRHGDFQPSEIKRILKPSGIFITQQVGAENDRELVELLYNEVPPLPFPEQYLQIAKKKFEDVGLSIVDEQEAYLGIHFFDVAALVWFARIIEWEFPKFSVANNFDGLLRAQDMIDKNQVIEGRIHRFLLVARKEEE